MITELTASARKMAQINSSQVQEEYVKGLKLARYREKIPSEVEDKVKIVYVSNPIPEIKVATATVSDATSGTLMSTHATKRTYLIGAHLSLSKDAVSDSIRSHLAVFPKGFASTNMINLRYEPTTAASNLNASITLSKPMLLEKGSNISILNGTNTASIDVAGSVYYYEEDEQ